MRYLTSKSSADKKSVMHVSIIGCSGVPNRYGGFEAFVENCGPAIAREVDSVVVTCDAALYSDRSSQFCGMERVFIPVRANGGASVLHDALAFFSVFWRSTHILVLGVSGGVWFPIFRLLCELSRKRLIVNIDGVEWRRSKFGFAKRLLLKLFDCLAQCCSHVVVYDNPALRPYVLRRALSKAVHIGYSGDHVLRLPSVVRQTETALTICRIEPENNLEILIQGVLHSQLKKYTIVGNWSHSAYSRELREKYAGEPRLVLLDPVYDANRLAELRESCEFYLHGHSVGGTNPSLVEMLFYDCCLLCLDVQFNRETARDCADYFSDANELTKLLSAGSLKSGGRVNLRGSFTSHAIAAQYLSVFNFCGR